MRRAGGRPTARHPRRLPVRYVLLAVVVAFAVFTLYRVATFRAPDTRAAQRGREAEDVAAVMADAGLHACWRGHAAAKTNGTSQPPPGAADVNVIPRPAAVHRPSETLPPFALSKSTRVDLSAASEDLRVAFAVYWQCFFGAPVVEGTGGSIVAVRSADTSVEGYILTVASKRVEIGCSDRRGLLHAVQTLRQLIGPAAFGEDPSRHTLYVPVVSVVDEPRHRWRGVMLDVARHFFSVEEVLSLLLLMSAHKLNVLHLHLTDDQGWRIEIPSYPSLAKVGGKRGPPLNPATSTHDAGPYAGLEYSEPAFYSVSDVRSIVAFAAGLGIDVLPEVDIPAHTAALINGMRAEGELIGVVELHEGCEGDVNATAVNCFGGTHGMIVPFIKTLHVVDTILTEVSAMFPFRYLHIGGDEAAEFRDSAYRALREELGAPSGAVLQGRLVDHVHGLVTDRLGKTLVAWDDTFLSLGSYRPPPDMAMMWWRDWAAAAKLPRVQRAARPTILAPSSQSYFDMYQTEPHSASKVAAQDGTVPLEKVYNLWATDAGQGTMGVHGCLWTERLKTWADVEYQLFPRGAALAEAGWTPAAQANYSDFVRRWEVHEANLDRLGVGYCGSTK
eukprot:TRINITY_DN26395_c0_g1_i1.p1 TRINITY_DN26395_c0_g1~~TRINITY_DN26395_c0_g1_i1.p1  ORF type:complete len:615 (+),score=202.66 TRINITY_DN26395_c0_g1_i1:72-1916(+)